MICPAQRKCMNGVIRKNTSNFWLCYLCTYHRDEFPPSVGNTSSVIIDSEAARQKIIIKETPKKISSPKLSFLSLQQAERMIPRELLEENGTGSDVFGWWVKWLSEVPGPPKPALHPLPIAQPSPLWLWGRTGVRSQIAEYLPQRINLEPTDLIRISSFHFCLLSLLIKPWTWNSLGNTWLLMLSFM